MISVQLLDAELPTFAQKVENGDEDSVADSYDWNSSHLYVLVGTIGHAYPGAVIEPDAFKENLQGFECGHEQQAFLQAKTAQFWSEHIEVQGAKTS